MKRYTGNRDDWSVRVEVFDGTRTYALHTRIDVVLHSYDFGWGKDNCASSQLAMALLCDHLGLEQKDRAFALYQHFAKEIIAKIPLFQMHWEIDEISIASWIARKDKEWEQINKKT